MRMKPLEVMVPIRVKGPNGSHGHPQAAAGRKKRQRNATTMAIRVATSWGSAMPQLPVTVTLTRLSAGKMDSHDNLCAALKSVVDAVALEIGLPVVSHSKSGVPQADDSSPLVTWVYRQEKAKRGTYGVRITVEPRTEEERSER